ncbi:carbonic anhydrase [Radiobacillus kanasensis]|uniref:beta-class carbonic anhydrase n=1 Tax=Radiobacillus kanasensis TaxID=2844358 RepID=UPI001E47B2BD|nr:carbonic anhydrase [Radiobacillus kanasensis]UFU00399.1 carbonic anhydrase [Radiobacillus kanasensis]
MLLDDVLSFNQKFVEEELYVPYEVEGLPKKRAVVLSCMDTRLIELLPNAMNIKNGDVKMVKNAGGIITSPFDSVVRSILIALYMLEADEVFIIGHHRCGMGKLEGEAVLDRMKKRGVSEEKVQTLEHAGLDLKQWLKGFDTVEASVQNSVEILRNHPLLPAGTPVHGLVIDPKTGKLDLVERGY